MGKRETVAGISLSHPDKEFFPKAAITKRDLAEYYESLADRVLPHVIHRPLTVHLPPHASSQPFYDSLSS